MVQVCQSNVKLMTDVNKCRHSFFICVADFQVDKNSHHSAMESERVIMMIVALFLLIIAIRKVQRFRFHAHIQSVDRSTKAQ